MMTGVLDDFQPAIRIPFCLHTIDAISSSPRVHPVLIAIHKCDAHIFTECVDTIDKGQMGVCTEPKEVRDTIFARALGEGDIRYVVMQVARIFG
jgi:2-C-methyl-D-erythritol 4-phosphate cytidylyltransferase